MRLRGSHALIGAEIARRFDEDPDVVHGIEAHHNEVEPRTVLAVIVRRLMRFRRHDLVRGERRLRAM